jgi:hypothetical protein
VCSKLYYCECALNCTDGKNKFLLLAVQYNMIATAKDFHVSNI